MVSQLLAVVFYFIYCHRNALRGHAHFFYVIPSNCDGILFYWMISQLLATVFYFIYCHRNQLRGHAHFFNGIASSCGGIINFRWSVIPAIRIL